MTAERPETFDSLSRDELAMALQELQETNPRLFASLTTALARSEKRVSPPELTVSGDREISTAGKTYPEHLARLAVLADTLGSTPHSRDYVQAALSQLEKVTRTPGASPRDATENLNQALAMLAAIKPENEFEAAWGIQMAGCHALGTEMLNRSAQAKFVEHAVMYGNLAVKLMRTFSLQAEALTKIRSGGRQHITVNHVHAQNAVVGDVHHGGGGVVAETQPQPHALSYINDPSAPMWGEDASRDALRRPRDEGEAEVSPTRRPLPRRPARAIERELEERSAHEGSRRDEAAHRGPVAPVARRSA